MKDHSQNCQITESGVCTCMAIVCSECGALVAHQDKHDDWHYKLDNDHDKIWRAGLE